MIVGSCEAWKIIHILSSSKNLAKNSYTLKKVQFGLFFPICWALPTKGESGFNGKQMYQVGSTYPTQQIKLQEFLLNLIKYQMSTSTLQIKLSKGFREYLDLQSLINTQRNLTAVTNNWFNDLPQSNYLLSCETFIFF